MKRIRSIEDIGFVCGQADHVLTLFSGGLDSTYLLKLLRDQAVEVTALVIDLGDELDLPTLAGITKRLGATLSVIDAKTAFTSDSVLPAIRAHGRYLNNYPISSSLSRPIIARMAVEFARRTRCSAIFHTATQSQNSLRRLNTAIEQLGYEGFYGSPHEFSAISREEKAATLHEAGINCFSERIVSGDSNLWCREFESGVLENPERFEAPEALFKWTRRCRERQLNDSQHRLSVTFKEGEPTAVNGNQLSPVELIAYLNDVVGAYGIGRFAGLEHLKGGEKVLEVREAPAAQVLLETFRHLETATHPYDLLREKHSLEQRWVQEAVEGRWFGLLREAIDSFIMRTAVEVSGTVAYDLSAGALGLISIVAEKPLYLTDRDGWEREAARICGSRSLTELHNSPTDSRIAASLAMVV